MDQSGTAAGPRRSVFGSTCLGAWIRFQNGSLPGEGMSSSDSPKRFQPDQPPPSGAWKRTRRNYTTSPRCCRIRRRRSTVMSTGMDTHKPDSGRLMTCTAIAAGRTGRTGPGHCHARFQLRPLWDWTPRSPPGRPHIDRYVRPAASCATRDVGDVADAGQPEYVVTKT